MKAKDQILCIREPGLSGVELLHAPLSTHPFPSHYHDEFYVISYIHHGASSCRSKTSYRSCVKQGEIALINPGQIHSGIPVEGKPLSFSNLHIRKDSLREFSREIRGKDQYPEFERIVVGDAKSTHEIRQFLDCFISNEPAIAKESSLYSLMASLLKQYSKKTRTVEECPEEHQFLDVMEFLSQNLDSSISLDEAAQLVGLSKYYFLRRFTQINGVTPHVFRTQKRIEKAKEWILEEKPLADIAIGLGFADQSHFSKKFKEYTGATPLQFFGKS